MPDLGDFLGTLLGELATARLQGDVATIRVADIYASNELLKHLPVPRFRMPEVRIDLPAIVESPAGRPVPLDAKRSAATMVSGIRRAIDARDIPLTRTQESRLARAVTKVVGDMSRSAVPMSSQDAADEIMGVLTTTSSSRTAGAKAQRARADSERADQDPRLDAVREEVVRQLAVVRAGSARISVLTHTSALREVPDADRLVRINLVISEEAVEWTVLDTADGPRDRLVQE